MALTAAERAKRYRDRLKQKRTKYNEFKEKDCRRKAKKRSSMTAEQQEKYLDNHRKTQQRYRNKMKLKMLNQTSADPPYNTKQTLSKAVKKVLRVLPNNPNKKKQVYERVGHDLGLLAKPKAARTSASISPTIMEKVKKFYITDAISWQTPGKRDTKTIKENGINVKYQKRHLLYNIREVYELFIQENPSKKTLTLFETHINNFISGFSNSSNLGVSISRSSFAKLRPKYVLHKKTLPHRSCLCVTHENINLLLNALSNEINGLKDNLAEYTLKMVCDDTSERCMMSFCGICQGNFAQQIIGNIVDKKKIINWSQWVTSQNRTEKKDFSGSVLQCVKQLQQKTPQYLLHVFIKRKQSDYFEYIKENANDGTVVCQVDYAENFTLQDQNQIQSAHWSTKQISLFTAYAWMGGSGGEGYSFGFVSNSPKHDKFSVITCLEVLIQEIIDINPDVDQIIFFSDGAASQFKNRFIIQHLSTMMDTSGLDFSWNYFASSHGKGIVDSIGGTLKRIVWLEVLAGNRCRSAEEFVHICCQKTKTIIVRLLQQAQFDIIQARLEKAFHKLVAFPNIRKQHHINVLHKDVIEYALYTTRKEKYVFRF